MGYDLSFYERYERYLVERTVRTAHDRALRIFGQMARSPDVVDLGCGKSQEFRRFGPWTSYVGYDANAEKSAASRDPRPGDYRDPGFIDLVGTLSASAFVSLFSTEITAPAEENTRLYTTLFERAPTMHWGLVSGFYYAGSKNVNPIQETGGISSYQTLHALEEQATDTYDEYRIEMQVPSAMFGDDVVEVWRILQRR